MSAKVDAPELNLDGHRAITLDRCFDCQGKLRAEDGTFSERRVSVSGTSAFAAAICNKCKALRTVDESTICGKNPAGDRAFICTLAPKHKGVCVYKEIE